MSLANFPHFPIPPLEDSVDLLCQGVRCPLVLLEGLGGQHVQGLPHDGVLDRLLHRLQHVLEGQEEVVVMGGAHAKCAY